MPAMAPTQPAALPRSCKGKGKGKADRADSWVQLTGVSGLKVASLKSPGLAEKALAEVSAHFKERATGRSSQMFEIGWSFHAWDKEWRWSRAKSLDDFPHLRSLMEEAMLCLTDGGDLDERGLNVICRRYARGQCLTKHTDRKDAFTEDVFGCVLENTSDRTLEFEEQSRSGEVLRWTNLDEKQGACFLQSGEARYRWIHGVESLSHGQRVSVSWRWFSHAASDPKDAPKPASGPKDAPKLQPQPSELSEHEKAFLKACGLVRDILKLEELKSSGTKLVTNQEQKLSKKSAALKDVRDKLENLPGDSSLRQKTQDVIHAAQAERDCPEQAPAVVEPQSGVYSDEKASPSVSAVESAADVKTATTQAPAAVEPQVDAAAGGKPGKVRGKRGGVSHNARKCIQRQVAGG